MDVGNLTPHLFLLAEFFLFRTAAPCVATLSASGVQLEGPAVAGYRVRAKVILLPNFDYLINDPVSPSVTARTIITFATVSFWHDITGLQAGGFTKSGFHVVVACVIKHQICAGRDF